MVTSRVSDVTDIFAYGAWPTMTITHTKISDNTVKEGQYGTWSTPKKSKVPQVYAAES